jgi:hypothetical protein
MRRSVPGRLAALSDFFVGADEWARFHDRTHKLKELLEMRRRHTATHACCARFSHNVKSHSSYARSDRAPGLLSAVRNAWMIYQAPERFALLTSQSGQASNQKHRSRA